MDTVLSLLSGLLVGVILGLLGGGGALVAIPILVYVLGYPFRVAIGSSLALVTLGALPAVALYAKRRQVEWRLVLVMGAGGAAGAALGSYFSVWVWQPVLLGLLIFLMAISALNLFMTRSSPQETRLETGQKPRVGILGLLGLAIGFLTGLVGVGGGFLLVPVLLSFGKRAPRVAIATSLVIIGVNAASGTLGHLGLLPLQDLSFWWLTAGCLVGSLGGFWISFRVPQSLLKQGFGLLLLVLILLLVILPPLS